MTGATRDATTHDATMRDAFAGAASRLPGMPPGARATQVADSQMKMPDGFFNLFGKPARETSCECERSNETTLTQAFMLISGEGMQQRLTNSNNRLAQWAASDVEPLEVVQQLYWSALSRPPTDVELDMCLECIGKTTDRRAALQDITWALFNSKEFLFRH